jgi:bacillithiol system protein YtxJ
MDLRHRMHPLTSVQEVDAFLEKFPTAVIFKAGSCHKTMQAFAYAEEVLRQRDLPIGFVRVIESREASNHITARTSVVHQSPQLILLIDGKAVYDVDNWRITVDAVKTAFVRLLGEELSTPSRFSSDLSAYSTILEQFLNETIALDAFREQWRATFKRDTTLRSHKEFQLLKSLEEGSCQGGIFKMQSSDALKQRAQEIHLTIHSLL